MSSTAATWVGHVKQATVFASLATLALETAATGSLLDVLAFLPVFAVAASLLFVSRTLSRECKHFLNSDLKRADVAHGTSVE